MIIDTLLIFQTDMIINALLISQTIYSAASLSFASYKFSINIGKILLDRNATLASNTI